MSSSPTSVITKASTSLAFTYTAPASAEAGTVQVQVPAGWTAPQVSSSTSAGYTSAQPSTCSSASVTSVAGTGPYTIAVAVSCPAAGTFVLHYGGAGTAGVRSPRMIGTVTFSASAEFGTATTFTALDTSPQVTVTTNVGSVALKLTPGSIPVHVGQTQALVTVTDLNHHPLVGQPPKLTGAPGQTIGPVTDNGDGTYVATVTAGDVAGSSTITSTDLGVSASAPLVQTPGPLTFTLSGPSTLVADGVSTGTVTVHAADAYGNPISGAAFTSAAPLGSVVGPFTDHGDGSYTATLTAGTTAGQGQVTVTNVNLYYSFWLTLTPGPPSSISMQLSPSSILADGLSTSALQATVTDAHGNGVAGQPPTLTSSGDDTLSPVTDAGGGLYTAAVTASRTGGDQVLTATDGVATGQTTLHQIGGPAISITLASYQLVADGVTATTATVVVTDATNHRVTSDPVVVSASGGSSVSAVTHNTSGSYSAQVQSSTQPGDETITATDGPLTSHVTLREIPRWTQVSTNLPPSAATMTTLADGRALLTGGQGRSNTAEIYDPATGTYSATTPMLVGRASHSATLLQDGRVLVAGGDGVGTAEIYDPTTATWTATGSMSGPRAYHTATLLQDGRVLVVGGAYDDGQFGSDRGDAEVYDPKTGTWSMAGTIPTPVTGFTATLLADGKVLIAGGQTSDGAGVTTSEVYDPATNAWTVVGPMIHPRWSHTATLLPNGKVLVTGGPSTGTSAELYDPATRTWQATGSTGAERWWGGSAVLLGDGTVLLAGGGNPSTANLTDVEIYTPATGTWTETTPLPASAANSSAVLLGNGDVLLTGVAWGGYQVTEIYDSGPS
jgi:hypothetical protein